MDKCSEGHNAIYVQNTQWAHETEVLQAALKHCSTQYAHIHTYVRTYLSTQATSCVHTALRMMRVLCSCTGATVDALGAYTVMNPINTTVRTINMNSASTRHTVKILRVHSITDAHRSEVQAQNGMPVYRINQNYSIQVYW